MSKYIKNFTSEASLASALESGLQRPNISLVTDTGKSYCFPANAWGIVIPVDGSTSATFLGSEAAWQAYRAKLGRYLLKWNGEAWKLSSSNSTQLANGTTFGVDDGNVMVRLPRLSYSVVRDSSGRDVIIMSEEPCLRNVIEEQWVGAYLASHDGTRLRSKRGMAVAASRTIDTFWTQAQACGSAWGLSNYEQRILMMLIYLSQYRSLNSQASLGYGMNGNTNNWSEAQGKLTGESYSLGDACGAVSGGTSNANAKHVSLFGIENPYGWYWEMLQGIYFINNVGYVYSGNRMPDATELASHPKGSYRTFTRNSASGQYITRLVGGEYYDILPSATGGGSESYWCDYTWTGSSGQLLLWGGIAGSGSVCGLACSGSSNAWSSSSSSYSARLAYYGKVNIY